MGAINGYATRGSEFRVAGETWPDNCKQSVFFDEIVTLTSAAAATAVNIIPDAMVGSGQKVYVTNVFGQVDGGTLWATTSSVALEGTDGTDFLAIAVAALSANAKLYLGTANFVPTNLVLKNTGGTAGYGLQLKGNANGTGSNLVLRVQGYIR